MAKPVTRSEFKEYVLRKLGKPVIDINVADEQAEDRIDEALAYYADYHFSGSTKEYLVHQLTQTDVDNKYIDMPDGVIGAVRIFPISGNISMGTGMFNVQYQFVLNNWYAVNSGAVVNYWVAVEYYQFMQDIFQEQTPMRFNRHVNKLFIDTADENLRVDEFVIIECYQRVDPDVYPDVWGDRWLANYTAAKIKYQWGSNLTKFNGMTLPGNIQFNGEQILNDAHQEIAKLEEEMISAYSIPVFDMIG